MDLLTDYIMIYYNMIVQVLLMIAFYLITSIISEKIMRSYNDFSSGKIESGVTGYDTAKNILRKNNIHNVTIASKSGLFTNSFSCIQRKIRLSEKIFAESSITAASVAAHKAAQATRASKKFSLMSFLYLLKSAAKAITSLFIPLLLVSTFVNIAVDSNIMLYVFAAILALQVIALPAELSAGSSALRELRETDLLTDEELYGSKKVMRSLSLSYISTIIITLIYVIRF